MTFIIKNVTTEEDLDRALDFDRRIFTASVHHELETYAKDKWLERMKQNGELMLYAEADGEIAGMVFARLEENGNMTVGPVATAPRFRKQGLARALLLLIEARAQVRGVRTLALGGAEAAEGFYLKCGYKPYLFVQASPPYMLTDLRALNTKYRESWAYDDGKDIRLMLDTEGIDKTLQHAYDESFPGCATQTLFIKNLDEERSASDIGNYVRHAKYWDWSGYDRTDEFEYWRAYAAKYGTNVLIPMCAWGEAGAYMAERGMNVTAFDITKEMVDEGRKRFGGIGKLRLEYGDIRHFSFDMTPADFCYLMDMGHILTITDVTSAFRRISCYLRVGGGFVLEAGLPEKQSIYYTREEYQPLRQIYPGLRVWKTGVNIIDAETARHYILQAFYTEDESGAVEQFDHAFYLQGYTREDLVKALRDGGFEIRHEYRNREKEPWREGDGLWIAEAVKVRQPE